MVLPDVSILVAAYRDDAQEHASCRPWLEGVLGRDEAFAISDLVLSGFLRIVTHPRIFALPSPSEHAIEFANVIRDQPHCVPARPGLRHWGIFTRLCRDAEASGYLPTSRRWRSSVAAIGLHSIVISRASRACDGAGPRHLPTGFTARPSPAGCCVFPSICAWAVRD